MHKAIASAGLLLLVGAAVACKSEARSVPSADAAPVVDPTKPYLTDERMSFFVQSMRADGNPFDFLFRMNVPEDAQRDPATAGVFGSERLARLDTFAREFGLAGAEEYFQIWTRVMLADMTELAEAGREMGDEMAKALELRLQRPSLPEEERRDLEKQLALVKEKFAAEDVRGSALNSADLDVVRRFKPQIEEALKKWNP
jgi:hypothetical protein